MKNYLMILTIFSSFLIGNDNNIFEDVPVKIFNFDPIYPLQVVYKHNEYMINPKNNETVQNNEIVIPMTFGHKIEPKFFSYNHGDTIRTKFQIAQVLDKSAKTLNPDSVRTIKLRLLGNQNNGMLWHSESKKIHFIKFQYNNGAEKTWAISGQIENNASFCVSVDEIKNNYCISGVIFPIHRINQTFHSE